MQFFCKEKNFFEVIWSPQLETAVSNNSRRTRAWHGEEDKIN